MNKEIIRMWVQKKVRLSGDLSPSQLDALKGVVIITYPWWAGKGHGKMFWHAELNGDTVDYHTKETLIRNSKEKGQTYVVVRHHRSKPGYTLMQSNA